MRKRRLPPPPPPPHEGFVLRRGRSGELEEFPNKMIEQMSEYHVATNVDPDWRRDPTYNLRRKKHGT